MSIESKPLRLNMTDQVETMLLNRRDERRLTRVALQAAHESRPNPLLSPVLFFNASTRLTGISQNAAFSMLAAMGLQTAGVPVVHFGCHAGMSRCVLGTVRRKPEELPPCRKCVAQSERIFGHAPTVWFRYHANAGLQAALEGLNAKQLSTFEYPFDGEIIPLGGLVLHSIRWALRRHDLEDDKETRFYLREYILSAYHLAKEYAALLDRLKPGTLVIFNGVTYPEATARWVGRQRGYRVVTYEVAYEPFSAFFTEGNATRYPIEIPPEFELNSEQNTKLDTYLEKRLQGRFTMAGIRFWPEMRGLDEAFLQKMEGFKQVVTVFTNVIYDTSQVGTNVAFHHMFDWLDQLLPIVRTHADTLFVIRAHPDEMRPGKEAQQSVQGWLVENEVNDLPNVFFIPSREFISSYELIRYSKFVLVYNSSIGLEATLLGTPVVAAASSRYTQYPIVHFPQTPTGYQQLVEELLGASTVQVPPEFTDNARRFLYYQLYRASLPFGEFLESAKRPGFIHLNDFSLTQLHPDANPTIRVIYDGILENQPFLLPENL